MSDPPPLPPGDDPFEILGAGWDADELCLRRAYMGRVRVYRPDRSPKEFARIRQAYEEALERIRWARPPAEDEAGSLPSRIDTPERSHAVHERVGAAWQDVLDGASIETVLAGLGDPATDATVALHRLLLLDAVGGDLAAEVVAGLQRAVPVVDLVQGLLAPDEVVRLVTSDGITWPLLRKGGTLRRAASLARRRIEALLLRGRLDQAMEEVLDDRYVDDAQVQPDLAWAAQEVMAVAAWAGRPGTSALERRFGPDRVDRDDLLTPLDHHAAAKRLRAPWRAWTKRHAEAKVLRRFLILAPVLWEESLEELADELAVEFLEAPRETAEALEELGGSSSELLERFTLAADRVDRRAPDRITREVAMTLQRIEERLPASPDVVGQPSQAWARIASPSLRTLVVHEGLDPAKLSRALFNGFKQWPRLYEFREHLLDDRTLTALHALWRITFGSSREAASDEAASDEV